MISKKIESNRAEYAKWWFRQVYTGSDMSELLDEISGYRLALGKLKDELQWGNYESAIERAIAIINEALEETNNV